MKWLCLFCLAGGLSSTPARAPQLEGSFYTATKERGFHSDLFRFTGNRFYYYATGCLGTYEGQGTFTVKDDTLLLHCEQIAADTAINTSSTTDTGAIPAFYFRVTDKKGEPLAGATIASLKKRIGVSTNQQGEASLAYSLPIGDTLLVQFIGYGRVFISVKSVASQIFTIRLGPPYFFAAGETLAFQLKDVQHNSFAYRPLLDLPDSADDKLPYSYCERINSAMARRLVQNQ